MKPLYEVNRGEDLIGSHIKQTYEHVNLWIPGRDTEIGLLVSDSSNQQTISIQVKYSQAYLPDLTNRASELLRQLRVCSWLAIDSEELLTSRADLWVLVLFGFEGRTYDCVILRPEELTARLRAIYNQRKVFRCYFWVTEKGRCWETHDLSRADRLRIGAGGFRHPQRDFTDRLNDWSPVAELNY